MKLYPILLSFCIISCSILYTSNIPGIQRQCTPTPANVHPIYFTVPDMATFHTSQITGFYVIRNSNPETIHYGYIFPTTNNDLFYLLADSAADLCNNLESLRKATDSNQQ